MTGGRGAILGAVLVTASVAHADLKEDPCACSAVKPGFFRRAQLTGDWDGERDKLQHAGVTLQGTYAGEAFAAPGLPDRFVFAGLFVLSLDLELGKLVERHLGQVHISTLGIHGNGLTAELMDIYGTSGNVAPQDARVFEAWLDQPIGKATVRAGLLAADQEFTLARHSTALLDATFGIISQASYNLLGPVYPVATPGVSARLELSGFTARAAIYDGDQSNNHGVPTALGPDSLTMGEVEIGELVKLGGWHHSTRGNAFYAVLDHQLDRHVGAFARASMSPDQPVSSYIDSGVRIGPGPFRPHDFIGVGLAFARTNIGSQTLAEATYQAQLGWLTVQPDLQLLLLRDRTAAIVATRVTVVF